MIYFGAALAAMVLKGRFEESKHPRLRGKFRNVPGKGDDAPKKIRKPRVFSAEQKLRLMQRMRDTFGNAVPAGDTHLHVEGFANPVSYDKAARMVGMKPKQTATPFGWLRDPANPTAHLPTANPIEGQRWVGKDVMLTYKRAYNAKHQRVPLGSIGRVVRLDDYGIPIVHFPRYGEVRLAWDGFNPAGSTTAGKWATPSALRRLHGLK
jgi:hypothetical protein